MFVLFALLACLTNPDLYAARQLALSDRDGDGQTPDQGDCDDNDAERYQGAPESCDGEDDNCNGVIDEEGTDGEWYLDGDGDGFGADRSRTFLCMPPAGEWTAQGGDCDDADGLTFPGAEERCDSKDQDCDGTLDEDPVDPGTFYLDADGDGFGNATATEVACEPPTGYLIDGSDCDDDNAGTFPGADEVCDSSDNDCDGSIDEAPIAEGSGAWFPDLDADGFGDPLGEARCDSLVGYVNNDLDCDDEDLAVNPDAEEICSDGIDNDCDGGPGPCEWPTYIELDGNPGIRGETLAEWVANAVVRIDLNADGDMELLVGVANVDTTTGGMDAGSVSIWTEPPTHVVKRSDAYAAWTGDGASDFAGFEVAVCDMNGDGIDDVVSSAPGTTVRAADRAGAFHVLLGPRSLTGGSLASEATWSVSGDTTTRLLGYNLKCVPDMSGDGLPDLIMGYGGHNHAYSDYSGMVHIITTKDASLTTYLEAVEARIYTTDPSVEGIGSGVGAADYNGDGLADLITGSASDEPRNHLFEAPLTGEFTQDDAVVEFTAESWGDFLGFNVINLGDHNGDGYEDIGLSAQQAGYGAVYLFWGTATYADIFVGDAPAKLRGDVIYGFGATLTNLGDINGDGETDLGVTDKDKPGGNGYVFFGPFTAGGVRTQSTADVWLEGDDTDTDYEFITNIGDWNGDGSPELAVSASEHNGLAEQEGIVYFLNGYGM